MQTKKIIQVVPGFTVGGAEALVKEYLIHLQRKGCDVEAFCTRSRKNTVFEKELDEAGVKVVYLSELYSVTDKLPSKWRRIVVALKWRFAIKKYFKQKKPDVVHCHLSVAHQLIVASSQIKKAKLFYTVHSDPDKYWENGTNEEERKAILKLVRKRNMQMIALHGDAAEKIKKYFGHDCRVTVLNNAIDMEKYRNTVIPRESVRQELGISPNNYVVGHVGRFYKPKNHRFIIEVFSEIAKQKDEALLVLVGDGEYKKDIEVLALEKNLGDRVRFLGNRGDIPKLLNAFDVFLFPSLWEGFPITMIEAQAAGVPCVISDVITDDVKLTNLVKKMSLELPAEKWAEEVLNWNIANFESYGLEKYDINSVVSALVTLYG